MRRRRIARAGVWILASWAVVCVLLVLSARLPKMHWHAASVVSYCVTWITSQAGERWVRMVVGAAFFVINATWLVSMAGQWRRARRLLNSLSLTSPPADLVRLAHECGLNQRMEYSTDGRILSFTYGFWRPQIVITAGLWQRLDEEERRAVLLHERAHAAGRHPLRLTWARAMARALWFLPIVRDLAERYRVELELTADGFAMERAGRESLAKALLVIIEAQVPEMGHEAAAVTGFDACMRARVAQLRAPESGAGLPPWSVRSLGWSSAVIATYVVALALSCT